MRRNRCSSHVPNGRCKALKALSCSDTSNGEDDAFKAFLLGEP